VEEFRCALSQKHPEIGSDRRNVLGRVNGNVNVQFSECVSVVLWRGLGIAIVHEVDRWMADERHFCGMAERAGREAADGKADTFAFSLYCYTLRTNNYSIHQFHEQNLNSSSLWVSRISQCPPIVGKSVINSWYHLLV
jgi:hypothetical protein